MKASEIRTKAREKLANKWGKAVILTVIFGICSFVISYLLKKLEKIGPIISALIDTPLLFGYISCLFKLTDDDIIIQI